MLDDISICMGHTVEQEDTEEGDLAWLGTFRDVP